MAVMIHWSPQAATPLYTQTLVIYNVGNFGMKIIVLDCSSSALKNKRKQNKPPKKPNPKTNKQKPVPNQAHTSTYSLSLLWLEIWRLNSTFILNLAFNFSFHCCYPPAAVFGVKTGWHNAVIRRTRQYLEARSRTNSAHRGHMDFLSLTWHQLIYSD